MVSWLCTDEVSQICRSCSKPIDAFDRCMAERIENAQRLAAGKFCFAAEAPMTLSERTLQDWACEDDCLEVELFRFSHWSVIGRNSSVTAVGSGLTVS